MKCLVMKIDLIYSLGGTSTQQHVPLPFYIVDICYIW
jgi:hypothetical protein